MSGESIEPELKAVEDDKDQGAKERLLDKLMKQKEIYPCSQICKANYPIKPIKLISSSSTCAIKH